MGRKSLPGRVLSSLVKGPDGEDALKIEALPVSSGGFVEIEFLSWSDVRRQGLWVGIDGVLDSGGDHAPQMNFWVDTAPQRFYLRVLEAMGELVFYNVWESPTFGRTSQLGMAAMLVSTEEEGWRRYRCNDQGNPPDFGRLVFRLRVKDASGAVLS